MDTHTKQEDAEDTFAEKVAPYLVGLQSAVAGILHLVMAAKAAKLRKEHEASEEETARREAPWEYIVQEHATGEKTTPPEGLGTGWKICETRIIGHRSENSLAILWGREVQDD